MTFGVKNLKTKRNMKITTILAAILLVCCFACHEKTIGYLITENASYEPDTTFIYQNPDPVEEATRIENDAPWITYNLQGYEGTAPITFTIESVTSSAGEEQAALFMEELTIRGGGAMLYPLQHKAGPGTYLVSIRLTNEGYSQVIEDAYTFIIVE